MQRGLEGMTIVLSEYLSFRRSEVFEILAEKHRISYNKNVAFQGRLQHFQRRGFPPGINTGKGTKARYGWSELLLLGIALEYVEIGSTPDRCVAEIRKFEELILGALAKLASPEADKQEPYFLFTELSGLMALKLQSQWNERIDILSEDDLIRIFSAEGDDRYRSPYAIIDLRQFLVSILLAIAEIMNLANREIVADLRQWSSGIQSELF